jgi:filamentous hemagglutinin
LKGRTAAWRRGAESLLILVALLTGAWSVAAPQVDLRAEEARGGHTIARHVGQSDAALRRRLAAEPEIAFASSFDDLADAEAAVGAALAANAADIDEWLAGRGAQRMKRIDYDAGGIVGRVLARGAAHAASTSRLRVILRRTARETPGYLILTAFPEE